MIFLPHTCLTDRQVLSFYHSITRAMQFKKAFIWSKNLYSCLPARQVSLQFKKYKSLQKEIYSALKFISNLNLKIYVSN